MEPTFIQTNAGLARRKANKKTKTRLAVPSPVLLGMLRSSLVDSMATRMVACTRCREYQYRTVPPRPIPLPPLSIFGVFAFNNVQRMCVPQKGMMRPSGSRAMGWLDQKAGSALHEFVGFDEEEDGPLLLPTTTATRLLATGRFEMAAGFPSTGWEDDDDAGDVPSFEPPIKSFLEVCYVVGLGAEGVGGPGWRRENGRVGGRGGGGGVYER